MFYFCWKQYIVLCFFGGKSRRRENVFSYWFLLFKDNSTSCDDEITWIRRPPALKGSTTSGNNGSNKISALKQQDEHHQSRHHQNPRSVHYKESKHKTSGKPPKPTGNTVVSLDRRRHNPPNRQDRDSKSRSSHSLREKSNSKNSLLDSKDSKEESSSSQGERYHRKSPFWEPPPPPPHHWDPHYYNYASREELRMMDFYRRPYDPRYGSCQDLLYNQHPSTLSLTTACDNGCCGQQPRFYPTPCCSHYNNNYQVQFGWLWICANLKILFVCDFEFILLAL